MKKFQRNMIYTSNHTVSSNFIL